MMSKYSVFASFRSSSNFFYGSTPAYRPVLEIEGWDALQPELNALSKKGGWAEMANLVTDEMVAGMRAGSGSRPTQIRPLLAACACARRAAKLCIARMIASPAPFREYAYLLW